MYVILTKKKTKKQPINITHLRFSSINYPYKLFIHDGLLANVIIIITIKVEESIVDTMTTLSPYDYGFFSHTDK